jgi:hypothetical protein
LYYGHPPKQPRCRQIEAENLTEFDDGTIIVEEALGDSTRREDRGRSSVDSRAKERRGKSSSNDAFLQTACISRSRFPE